MELACVSSGELVNFIFSVCDFSWDVWFSDFGFAQPFLVGKLGVMTLIFLCIRAEMENSLLLFKYLI